jgi:hypothetical protein
MLQFLLYEVEYDHYRWQQQSEQQQEQLHIKEQDTCNGQYNEDALRNDLLHAAQYMLAEIDGLETDAAYMHGRINIHIVGIGSFQVIQHNRLCARRVATAATKRH